MAPANGRIEIEIVGLPPGTEIVVVFVTSGDAGITFPVEGSSSETFEARGQIRVSLASGPVRVELPSAVAYASLTVQGRIYLTKEGDRLGISGPVERQSQGLIQFRTDR